MQNWKSNLLTMAKVLIASAKYFIQCTIRHIENKIVKFITIGGDTGIMAWNYS